MRLLRNLGRSRWEREISDLAERLVEDYKCAVAQMNDATREMRAALAYITTEREEVLDRLHKMELQISALKLAVKRR